MKPLLAVLLLSACALPQDYAGQVYEITEYSITIRGAYEAFNGPFIPPAAMQEQAETLCFGATYLSRTPYPYDNWTFLYLFKCEERT